MDASSPRHDSAPMRLGRDVLVDTDAATPGKNSVGRRSPLRHVVLVVRRAFVEASAYESEGVVITRGWCFPWLCFPITPPSSSEQGRTPWSRGSSS
jgi:hypothetical protein